MIIHIKGLYNFHTAYIEHNRVEPFKQAKALKQISNMVGMLGYFN